MAMLAPTAGRASNPWSTQLNDTDWRRVSGLPFPLEKNQVKVYFGTAPVVSYSPETSESRPKTVSGVAPEPLPPLAHTENVTVYWRDGHGDLWCAYSGTFTYLSYG